MMLKRTAWLMLWLSACSSGPSSEEADNPESPEPPVVPGEPAVPEPAEPDVRVVPGDAPACVPSVPSFKHIYDPSVGESGAWYINDHSIIRGRDGLWHLFGITGPNDDVMPEEERTFAHATSPTLTTPTWTKLPPALIADASIGERVLWAPHVIDHQGTYYMFYTAGGEPDAFQMKLATSPDLMTWQRHPEPLFTDGAYARDPFVMRVGERWVMYYTATSEPAMGNHVIAYRTSTDLVHWEGREIAYLEPGAPGSVGGPTESPYIVARPEGFYLFIGPRNFDYVQTEVFFSRDPLHFEPTPLTNIPAHAPEIIVDLDGTQQMTRCGWGQGGVDIGALRWECPPADTI
jgi:arabinan endo-1,5-alpha-L-arabinosidase